MRDALGEMLPLAFENQIMKEPVISEADLETNEQGLVAVVATV